MFISQKKPFPQAKEHREGASQQADISNFTRLYTTILAVRPSKLHRDSSSQGQGQAGLNDRVHHPGRCPWDLAWTGMCTSPEVAGLGGHKKRFFLTNENAFCDQCGPREKGTTT